MHELLTQENKNKQPTKEATNQTPKQLITQSKHKPQTTKLKPTKPKQPHANERTNKHIHQQTTSHTSKQTRQPHTTTTTETQTT